jgi:hypothetical protein
MSSTAGACDVCAVAGVGGVTAAIGVHFPRERPAFNDVVVDRVRWVCASCDNRTNGVLLDALCLNTVIEQEYKNELSPPEGDRPWVHVAVMLDSWQRTLFSVPVQGHYVPGKWLLDCRFLAEEDTKLERMAPKRDKKCRCMRFQNPYCTPHSNYRWDLNDEPQSFKRSRRERE